MKVAKREAINQSRIKETKEIPAGSEGCGDSEVLAMLARRRAGLEQGCCGTGWRCKQRALGCRHRGTGKGAGSLGCDRGALSGLWTHLDAAQGWSSKVLGRTGVGRRLNSLLLSENKINSFSLSGH